MANSNFSVKPRKYLDVNGVEIRGVKVTKNTNVVGIGQWIEYYQGESESIIEHHITNDGVVFKDRIRVRTPKGWRVAHIGDVVCKTDEGQFYIIKAEELAANASN